MRAVVIGIALALLAPVFGWSQEASAVSGRAVEAFGGYSLEAGGVLGSHSGFHGGVDFPLTGHIQGVGEVGYLIVGTYGTGIMSETSFLFGPRYEVPLSESSRTQVFADVLAGADVFHNGRQSYTWIYNDGTGFALSVDGGVDYRVSRHFAVRGLGGYFYSRLTNSTYGGPVNPATTANSRMRVEASVVYRF
jgi:hypothetical protein